MYEIGQEVMVISDKGVAYDGYITATATSDHGEKAYKIALEGGGLTQLGQWHKACDIFVVDTPEMPARMATPIAMRSFRRN